MNDNIEDEILTYKSLIVFKLFGYIIRIKNANGGLLYSDRVNTKFKIFRYIVVVFKQKN
jgi:hypothetical protein